MLYHVSKVILIDCYNSLTNHSAYGDAYVSETALEPGNFWSAVHAHIYKKIMSCLYILTIIKQQTK